MRTHYHRFYPNRTLLREQIVSDKWLSDHCKDDAESVKRAVTMLVEVLSRLRDNRCVDAALYNMYNMNIEAYERQLQIVKDAVGWTE